MADSSFKSPSHSAGHSKRSSAAERFAPAEELPSNPPLHHNHKSDPGMAAIEEEGSKCRLPDFVKSLVPIQKVHLAEKALHVLEQESIDQVEELRRFSYSELRELGVPALVAKNLSNLLSKAASGSRLSYFDSDAYRRVKGCVPSFLASHSSEFIIDNQMMKTPPVFFNYRPDTARGMPLALVSPVFARFIDMCRETVVSPRDSAFVDELCREASKAYSDEHERCNMLINLLTRYLPVEFDFSHTAIYHDGQLIAFIQTRNEQGENGDAYLQGCRYYLKKLEFSLEDEMVQRWCYPVFLVEAIGPLLRISGAAFTDAPVIEPLRTGLLIRRSDAAEMDSLCRMMVAFRRSLEHLAMVPPPSQVELDLAQAKLPYALQGLQLRGAGSIQTMAYGETYVVHVEGLRVVDVPEEELPPSMMALARIQRRGVKKVFVKFTQRYGSEVHGDWFQRGCAPELFETVTLGGGWLMVCMEYMDGYISLEKARREFPSRWHQVGALAHRCLDTAQGSGLKGVHGDLRLPNLMVDMKLTRVIAVDFGWAGIDGIDKYPYYMNHAEVSWPEGACDGAFLRQEHDRELLSSQLALKMKRKYVWSEDRITLPSELPLEK